MQEPLQYLPVFGAFGFGLVIGWFVYFTNRYRKGDISFSDLTTLIGIVGGGGITALFGDVKGLLFGAYGLGLAVGFFGYFISLLILVKKSNGVFTWTWFLDGRKKKLANDEEIGSDTRATIAPMDLQSSMATQALPLSQIPRNFEIRKSLLAQFSEQRNRAISTLVTAERDLTDRAGATINDHERQQLEKAQKLVSEMLDELVASRLKDILESDETKAALRQLTGITDALNAEASRLKSATDAVATTARVIDRANQVIGLLAAFA